MDGCGLVVCCLQLFVCCCLVWTADGHAVDYYETMYPELFKRDHRKLYSSIDHRKYFCNCDMQKGEDASLTGNQLHSNTLVSSLSNKAAIAQSNKTDVRIVELDESQADELLNQEGSSDSKSKRTVQQVYLVVSLGGLLVVLLLLTVVFVVCLVWRRIQRKSSSTADSSVRLHHHLQHLQHQLSSSQHPHKQQQQQQQQPSLPQATHQLHHRSGVVASPLGAGDYKLTDLRCCQKDGDDIFYPTAYGYNFCFSKQRLALDSGKTKQSAETKIQWNDAPTMEKPAVKSNCKAIACANDNPLIDSRSASCKTPASVDLRREINDGTESVAAAQSETKNVRLSSYYHSFDSSEKVLLQAKK